MDLTAYLLATRIVVGLVIIHPFLSEFLLHLIIQPANSILLFALIRSEFGRCRRNSVLHVALLPAVQ